MGITPTGGICLFAELLVALQDNTTGEFFALIRSINTLLFRRGSPAVTLKSDMHLELLTFIVPLGSPMLISVKSN